MSGSASACKVSGKIRSFADDAMLDLCKLMWCALAGLFRSRAAPPSTCPVPCSD